MSRSALVGIVVVVILVAAIGVWYATRPAPTPAPTTAPPTTTAPPATTTPPEQVTGEIDFYTSIPKTIAVELVEAFQAKYPNIKVNLVRSGTSKILAKLAAEVESGEIIADVVWVADPSGIINLKNQGLLMKYTPPEPKVLMYIDPDGYYVAGRIIVEVIAYNTEMVANPPQRWTDLADPAYKQNLPEEWRDAEGWCNMPNPLYSGSASATVYGLSNTYGWDFFRNLKANGVTVVRGNTQVAEGVASGQFPVGVTLDYMVRSRKADGLPIDYVFPEDGAIFIPSPIAILNTTPYPEAAKIFVDFMLSPEVQQILAQHGIYPARTDVDPPAGAPKVTEIKSIPIDWDAMAAELEQLRATFEEIMLRD